MGRYSNCKRGWRTVDGKKLFFDSKGEFNFYQYLRFLKKNKEIKDFVYHPPFFSFEQWIRFGVRRYEVDFKVIELDGREWYVEIKSTNRIDKMDPASRTRINRFKKYYSEIDLKIYTTNEVEKLNFGGVIDDWEY